MSSEHSNKDKETLNELGVWLAGLGIVWSQKMTSAEGTEIMRKVKVLIEKTLIYMDQEIQDKL